MVLTAQFVPNFKVMINTMFYNAICKNNMSGVIHDHQEAKFSLGFMILTFCSWGKPHCRKLTVTPFVETFQISAAGGNSPGYSG